MPVTQSAVTEKLFQEFKINPVISVSQDRVAIHRERRLGVVRFFAFRRGKPTAGDTKGMMGCADRRILFLLAL